MQGRNRDTCRERTFGHSEGRECSINIYTLPCVKEIASGKLPQTTGTSAVPCDDLEGWEGGSRGRGDIYIYMYMCVCVLLFASFAVVVQQKLTQLCKAIILQLNKSKDKDIGAVQRKGPTHLVLGSFWKGFMQQGNCLGF